MKRKIPKRMCIGCGMMNDKRELVRIVKNKEGDIFYDATGKANGRGAYVCNNIECFDFAIKNKKFEKTFKQSISEDVQQQLRDDILNGK